MNKNIEVLFEKMLHDYSNYEFIDKNDILNILEDDICNLHMSEKYRPEDIYLFLLTNFIYNKNNNDNISAARLSYLISYYIFVLWTPPRSEFLSRYYIDISINLDPQNEEYIKFHEFILDGN